MKIVKIPDTGALCYDCKEQEFIVTTPSGADCVTCPLCENSEFREMAFDDHDVEYCRKCNIVFSCGEIHGCNGCCESTLFGELVTEFEWNGEKVKGMPVFVPFSEVYIRISKKKEVM